MFTDWILIERLARELNAKVAGARVTALGHLDDGRSALAYWRRGENGLIAFDLFGRTPTATLELGELARSSERGFIRSAGAVVRGLTLSRVAALRRERVLSFEFGSRSRFGVATSYVLIAELIPRFGNLLLVKDRTIVAAFKEFRSTGEARRTIRAGARYEPPPSRKPAEDATARLVAALQGQGDRKTLSGALRSALPDLPQLLADSLLAGLPRERIVNSETSAKELLERGDRLIEDAQQAVNQDNVLVYRDGGKLVQAHVVPLQQFAALERSAAPHLLPLFREATHAAIADQGSGEPAKHRRELASALARQLAKTEKEVAAVDRQLTTVSERDALRTEAEEILATLHERSEGERAEAKEKAASLFARYKRLGGSATPLTKRRAALLQRAKDLEELRWELERAGDSGLVDVGEAVAALLERRKSASIPSASKKRPRVSVQAPGGSRILVGRSPIENAELTFHVARRDDLWFHARGTPGAHVILQRDDRSQPPPEDIEWAASFAAFFSRAKEAPKVPVDYTLRKYVRKRSAAAPGLVFYTNAKTITVAPRPLHEAGPQE